MAMGVSLTLLLALGTPSLLLETSFKTTDSEIEVISLALTLESLNLKSCIT